MTITVNHTIVPAADNRAAAGFFASIMGAEELPPAGARGHFAPVRVSDTFTIEFMTVDDPPGHHLAFEVDPATFDAIRGRLDERAIPYGNHPAHRDNGRVDHPLRPRGLYFADAAGNLYEVLSR